jgi:hypothetical protein
MVSTTISASSGAITMSPCHPFDACVVVDRSDHSIFQPVEGLVQVIIESVDEPPKCLTVVIQSNLETNAPPRKRPAMRWFDRCAVRHHE